MEADLRGCHGCCGLGRGETCNPALHPPVKFDSVVARPFERMTRMTKPITGRCYCGAVRFQTDHAPIVMRACWCRDCQYLAAGNASINAVFKADGLTCTGEVGEHVSTADSGNV